MSDPRNAKAVNRRLAEMVFVTTVAGAAIASEVAPMLAVLVGIGAACAGILCVRLAPPVPKGYR